MSWREGLFLQGKGSFRGVEFFVKSVESTVGRRTVVHEIPGKDIPVVEDMGKLSRRFRLDCYVLGDDYMARRDALVREFELDGPGPLMHPYWGAITVSITGPITITESTDQGGLARISVNAVRSAIEVLQPEEGVDTIQLVNNAAAAADTATDEQFKGVEVDESPTSTARADQFKRGDVPDADSWTVFGVIEDVRNKAQVLGGEAADMLSAVNKYINSTMDTIDDIQDDIDAFSDDLATLILTPETMAGEIRSIFSDITAKMLQYEGAWNSYKTEAERFINAGATPAASPSSMTPDSSGRMVDILTSVMTTTSEFGDDLDAITGTTPMELIAAGNQRAFVLMVKNITITEICRIVVQFSFGSFDEAIDLRDLLANYLDTLAATGGDLSYRAMIDLRTAISRHLSQAAEELPRIVRYTPNVSIPALVLAQKLYGDAKKDVDIITRNNIRDPLLVPGSVELQVLSDE